MEDKLQKYFTMLRYFAHVLMNRLISNGVEIKYDLKVSQLRAIAAFKEESSYTMNALAQSAMVRLPNMTRMVDSLIKDDIAVREKSIEDRRKVMVRLTPKGKNIRTQFMAIRRANDKSTLSPLLEKDKNKIKQCPR